MKSAGSLIVKRGIEERAQAMAAAGMPQFPERLGLDLPYALARHGEMLADLFERVLAAVLQSKAHLDDLLFAGTEGLQDFGRLFAKVQIDDRLGRRHHAAVDQKIAEMGFFFLTDRRLERDRLLRDPQDLAHLSHRQLHAHGQLFGGLLAPPLPYARA